MSTPDSITRNVFDDIAGRPKHVLDRQDVIDLSRHVVNLRSGQVSGSGAFSGSAAQVQRIFSHHIPAWHAENGSGNKPLRVMLFAHGGLVSEAWGLEIARTQRQWWLDHGVYPVFMVWETGLFEALADILRPASRFLPVDTSRGFLDGLESLGHWLDEAEDVAWETAVRRLGGPRIWQGMKSAAALPFLPNGFGQQMIAMMADLVSQISDPDHAHSAPVEFHAVGHSAGSIFMTHLIDAAVAGPMDRFESLHLLAPAMTADLFKGKLLDRVGSRGKDQIVKRLTVFTMDDAAERADTVWKYDKSLLYLIHRSLEPRAGEPILGLEVSLRSEPQLADFFDLDGGPTTRATDLVFSKPQPTGLAAGKLPPHGPSESHSMTHGCFDNDAATMQSVLIRITGAKDTANVKKYPATSDACDAASRAALAGSPLTRSMTHQSSDSIASFNAQFALSGAATPPRPDDGFQASGKRSALCVGINSYHDKPLAGCVHDAKTWAALLSQHGYQTQRLLDDQASLANIRSSLNQLIRSAAPGDSIVFQFAGHGTQVADVSGDEQSGDTPGKDEALVPHDYLQAGLFLDDELGELCEQIAEGVDACFIFDCCHSGTATRMFLSASPTLSPESKTRFLAPTPAMLAAHQQAMAVGSRAFGAAAGPYFGRRERLFAACASGELAFETAGRGDFTAAAVELLKGNPALSSEAFIFAVRHRFGPAARQTPGLWCDSSLRSRPVLSTGVVA